MKPVWEISGVAGATLDAGRMSLESAGVDGLNITEEALDVDVAQWTQRSGTIPDRLQEVTLWRDGVRVFRGRVTQRPFTYKDGGKAGYSVTAHGPMWFMANTKITDEATDSTGATSTRASIQFPPGDLAASVRRLIDRATAAGVPLRAGHIDSMFAVGRMTFTGETWLSALVKMLLPVADATSYVDYDADGLPTLNIVRRSQSMPSIDLAIGVDDIASISLTPRDEMRATGVRVLSATRSASGALVFSEETVGGPGNVQIVTVSGPEIGTYLVPENLPKIEIQTATVTADFTEASALDSSLKPAIPLGLPTMGIASGVYSLYTAPSGGASLVGMTSITGQFNDQSTGTTLLGTWHRITTGQVIDFLKTDYGLLEAGIEIKSEYWARLPGDLGTVLDTYPGLRYLRDQGRLRSNSGYVSNVPSPGNTVATDVLVTGGYSLNGISIPNDLGVPTFGYPTLQTVYAKAAIEYLYSPPGLAQNLFDAQNFVPFQGEVSLNPGAPYRRYIGSRLNILNGPDELRTAGAIIQGSRLDVRSGSISLRCGSPARVSMSAVSGKYTAADPNDNVATV